MTTPMLLTEHQVSAEYGIPVRQLQAQRYRRVGFPYTKIGASVYYTREDIDAYIAANKHCGWAA